jgi:predicted transcriptional regulator
MALKINFVDELVQRAQHLASQLVEQQKATRALADALQSNELDSLKAALAAAVRV